MENREFYKNEKMTKEEINRILEEHKLWLETDGNEGRYADLSNANLINVYLHGADLSYANLSGADLSYANLCDVVLCGADLSDANLHYALLEDADLGGANLTGANFTGAILDGATFKRAMMKETNFNCTKEELDMKKLLKNADLMYSDMKKLAEEGLI